MIFITRVGEIRSGISQSKFYLMLMAAEHQHYVPQLLLRGFLSRDPIRAKKEQVHVFDLIEQRGFTPPVAKIMGERRFNEFWFDEETLATIEPATSRLESHVAPLIERIRTEKRLERTREEIADLALLMAFQFIRTKKMRLLPDRLDAQIRSHVRKLGFDPQKVHGLLELDEESLKREHVRHQVKNLNQYASLIAEKEFFLMQPPRGRTFYLGDHPVVLHNDEPRTLHRGHLGIGAAYIQIYLPLAADVMLCAYDKAVFGQLMIVRDEGLKDLQRNALANLMRASISPDQMKQAVQEFSKMSPVTALIEQVRNGNPILIGAEQLECYNSLQALQAHRFVVDPDGRFAIAREVIVDRESAEREAGVG